MWRNGRNRRKWVKEQGEKYEREEVEEEKRGKEC